jgi:hypothetical protein
MPFVPKRTSDDDDDDIPDAKKQKACTVRVNVGGRLFQTTCDG